MCCRAGQGRQGGNRKELVGVGACFVQPCVAYLDRTGTLHADHCYCSSTGPPVGTGSEWEADLQSIKQAGAILRNNCGVGIKVLTKRRTQTYVETNGNVYALPMVACAGAVLQ